MMEAYPVMNASERAGDPVKIRAEGDSPSKLTMGELDRGSEILNADIGSATLVVLEGSGADDADWESEVKLDVQSDLDVKIDDPDVELDDLDNELDVDSDLELDVLDPDVNPNIEPEERGPSIGIEKGEADGGAP